MKEKLKNDLYLCHHCKSCCSTVPVMQRGGNKGDEYNRLFHRLSFPGHLILSSVFRTFPTELMITDCHIILLMVTCLGTCQKFYLLKTMGEKECLLNSLVMVIIIYSQGKKLYYWVLHVLNNDSIILKIDTLDCCSAATDFEFSLLTLAFCQFMFHGDSSPYQTRLFSWHIAR